MELIDKAALVAEIERRLSLISQNTNAYEEGRKRTYLAVLALINTLEVKEVQEEPVGEELSTVAKEYAKSITDKIGYKLQLRRAVCFGAKWKEQQMMAKAIDGYVIEDIEEGNGDFLLSAEYLPKSMGLKDRQKVKVIVIKED